MVEAADHLQVLEAGQVLVDGRVLAREPDVLANLGRVADDVEARDPRRALVGVEQRGQDPDRGRLAGAVRAEQPEDAARLDAQIDAAKGLDVAVALVEAAGLDGWIGRHASTLAVGPRHELQAGDSADPVESPLKRLVKRFRAPNARLQMEAP